MQSRGQLLIIIEMLYIRIKMSNLSYTALYPFLLIVSHSANDRRFQLSSTLWPRNTNQIENISFAKSSKLACKLRERRGMYGYHFTQETQDLSIITRLFIHILPS